MEDRSERTNGMLFGTGSAILTAISLAAVLLPVRAGASTTELPDAAQINWSGRLEQRTLGDSSVLNEYTAFTASTDTADVALRIAFLPRFDCTTVIGIRFAGAMTSIPEAILEDGDVLTLTIDGAGLEWPLLVDGGATETTLWLEGEAARRNAVRRRVDTGSRASLMLPNAISISFSLLGSRRSAAEVESACLSHEPLPWGD